MLQCAQPVFALSPTAESRRFLLAASPMRAPSSAGPPSSDRLPVDAAP
jgi:hypothetical protein